MNRELPMETSTTIPERLTRQFQSTPQGWLCQSCGRSYGPTMMACMICNERINQREAQVQVGHSDYSTKRP